MAAAMWRWRPMASMVTSAPGELQPLQKKRDGGDLVALGGLRLLPEDEALAGRQAETRWSG